MGTFAYLAGPYTHPDPKTRRAREAQITRLASILTDAGFNVFSPLTHSAPFERNGVKKSGAEWLLHNRPFMDASAFLVVATLPGWEQSGGIREEVRFFRYMKKPIFFLSPDDGTFFI